MSVYEGGMTRGTAELLIVESLAYLALQVPAVGGEDVPLAKITYGSTAEVS